MRDRSRSVSEGTAQPQSWFAWATQQVGGGSARNGDAKPALTFEHAVVIFGDLIS